MNLPAPPKGSHLTAQTYHLFAGTVSPNFMYRRVQKMLTRAIKDDAFKDDSEHMPLILATLVEVIFDPDHIHRDKFMHPLYEGLRLMQTIVAHGIATAIVSNVPHDWMMQYLQSPKLCKQFAFLNKNNIFTSGQLGALKPAAAVFNTIGDRFHLKTDDILLIDDTPANILGARACNVQAVYFNHKEMPHVLKELRATEVITHKNESASRENRYCPSAA